MRVFAVLALVLGCSHSNPEDITAHSENSSESVQDLGSAPRDLETSLSSSVDLASCGVGICGCDPVLQTGCAAGLACRIGLEDHVPEKTMCSDVGSGGDGAPCQSNAECIAGFGCTCVSSEPGCFCRKYCRVEADCKGGNSCVVGMGLNFGDCIP